VRALACLVLAASAATAGGADAYDAFLAGLGAHPSIELREAAVEETPGMAEAACVDATKAAWIAEAPLMSGDDIASIAPVQRIPPVPGGLEIRFTSAGAVTNQRETTRLAGRWMAMTVAGKVVTVVKVIAPSAEASIFTTSMSDAQVERLCAALGKPAPATDAAK
jgi:hypothetical protein